MGAITHVKSITIADFTGTITVNNSAGATTTANATDLARPGDWNSAHQIANTISGNTGGDASTMAGTNLIYGGTGPITLKHSTAASKATLWFDAPAVSSLVAAGIVSLSSSSNTITVSVPGGYLSELIYPDHMLTPLSAIANGSMSLQPLCMPDLLSASKAAITLSVSLATAANTSSAGIVFSIWAGIYTRNGDTLNSLTTTSTTFSTWASSNATGSVNGIRELTWPMNVNMTPDNYVVMVNLSTNTAGQTSVANTVSVYGANAMQTAAIGAFGVNTVTSKGPIRGMGLYSATTNAVPTAISLTGVNATGANQSRANFAIGLYNE